MLNVSGFRTVLVGPSKLIVAVLVLFQRFLTRVVVLVSCAPTRCLMFALARGKLLDMAGESEL
jgi:hypothetical protein